MFSFSYSRCTSNSFDGIFSLELLVFPTRSACVATMGSCTPAVKSTGIVGIEEYVRQSSKSITPVLLVPIDYSLFQNRESSVNACILQFGQPWSHMRNWLEILLAMIWSNIFHSTWYESFHILSTNVSLKQTSSERQMSVVLGINKLEMVLHVSLNEFTLRMGS